MTQMTRKQRLEITLKGGIPDRVPCCPSIIRWLRYHYGCTCPFHQLKLAEDCDLDLLLTYGQYVWQSLSNDYVYAPGGGFTYAPDGFYGDLPEVEVELKIENQDEHVWYYRTFYTPAGKLNDVIQWARPNVGYGDGPNPHRVEPLVKSKDDLSALQFLYPAPRRDVIAEIPLVLEAIGDRGLLAACDNTHAGGWAMETLGPEGMLLASIEDPELLTAVCRLGQSVHIRNLRTMLEKGIRVVYDSWFQCGPSVGWAPQTYQDIFLPLIKETIDLAHEFGAIYVYQDDGKMKDIIPLVVEAGTDVLSGLQPPEIGDVVLRETKRLYGEKVALLGGLDPCYTFDLGAPQKVRRAVRNAINDAGAGGGYLVGTGESVSPETTLQSLLAAVEAVKAYGQY